MVSVYRTFVKYSSDNCSGLGLGSSDATAGRLQLLTEHQQMLVFEPRDEAELGDPLQTRRGLDRINLLLIQKELNSYSTAIQHRTGYVGNETAGTRWMSRGEREL
jgi:hypothetical protein